MLFDIYGELLTNHQQSVYLDLVESDMSLSEIADKHGITRQGAHDLIKRCDKILSDYESKLGLLGRFLKMQGQIDELRQLADSLPSDGESGRVGIRIREILDSMEEEI